MSCVLPFFKVPLLWSFHVGDYLWVLSSVPLCWLLFIRSPRATFGTGLSQKYSIPRLNFHSRSLLRMGSACVVSVKLWACLIIFPENNFILHFTLYLLALFHFHKIRDFSPWACSIQEHLIHLRCPENPHVIKMDMLSGLSVITRSKEVHGL